MSYNVSIMVSHRFLETYLDVFKRRNLITMAIRSIPVAGGIRYLVRDEDHDDFIDYVCQDEEYEEGNT